MLDKRRGMTETSFRRPAKKAASVPYLRPGWVRPDIRAAAVVDTSGSMGDEDVLAALVEVMGLVKATGAPVDVIAVSAQAARIGKISSVAALSAKFIAPCEPPMMNSVCASGSSLQRLCDPAPT